MKKALLIIVALGVLAFATLFIPVSPGDAPSTPSMSARPARLDLSAFPDAPPPELTDLLFIHHSCGGQLLAPEGDGVGTNCVYVSHPNGGDLRTRLEEGGYRVHEASYGSRIGEDTDIFHWLPKFRTQMSEILVCDVQDTPLPEGRRNRIVLFKSCYPNNYFRAQGTAPGDPSGPELTVWNAKATYAALLEEFKKQPDVLFVCLTAPPLASKARPQPLWKIVAKKVLGRPTNVLAQSGPLAREFNNWLSAQDGWLKDYPLKNVVVFDLYDVLTDAKSDFLAYPTGEGYDSHPSREGNRKAAEAFVPFLNRAYNRFTKTEPQLTTTATP